MLNKDNVARIIIAFNMDKGNITIGGDLENKALCMNMLAEAIKFIANHQTPVIQPLSGKHKN